MEHIFSCRYELGCSTKSGRIPSGAGIRISALKGRPRKRRDPPESPALQVCHFDLSPAEHDAVDAVHTDAAAVHMVLQLGYFKAKRQFFIYEPETVCADFRYIMKRHFPGM